MIGSHELKLTLFVGCKEGLLNGALLGILPGLLKKYEFYKEKKR
jgi:hypothetical protein